jgi:hypothetical protein
MGKKNCVMAMVSINRLFQKIEKELMRKLKKILWSHLDMEVHEHPIIEGNVGVIKAKVVHKDFKNLDHYIAKHNAYSTWEAQRYLIKKVNKANYH